MNHYLDSIGWPSALIFLAAVAILLAHKVIDEAWLHPARKLAEHPQDGAQPGQHQNHAQTDRPGQRSAHDRPPLDVRSARTYTTVSSRTDGHGEERK